MLWVKEKIDYASMLPQVGSIHFQKIMTLKLPNAQTWGFEQSCAGSKQTQNCSAYKLSINAANLTKIMELDKWQENTNIVIDNINVERVQSFQYLGAMFTTNGDGARWLSG